jgi:hypothetical protein
MARMTGGSRLRQGFGGRSGDQGDHAALAVTRYSLMQWGAFTLSVSTTGRTSRHWNFFTGEKETEHY